MSAFDRFRLLPPAIARHAERRVLPYGKSINTYLPTELLREVFLYCIESNRMESVQLASVCRHWRSIITSLVGLWSTLRIGTWTEKKRVTIWLQRAHTKKVVIDTQRDLRGTSRAATYPALRSALKFTDQWHELTVSSFPAENAAGRLRIQVASPMNMLNVLNIGAGCVYSPSLAHLLSLVPTEAPLSKLRLHPAFVSTHFLQPHWFPVLRNLTVLTVSGRDMDGPFELLPTFTQLQIFEADHLCLPYYEPDTNMPLICTLRKLQLRACSVQWMAGRQFPCLEQCAILLPRHWEGIRQHEVHLPSCKKFTYHGHPITTSQYFHVPEMSVMELKSHDCNEQRVYQHLRHLCRVDERISKLTTLHLTFQCSEQALIKVLKYLDPLQELVFALADLSPSWQNFLHSLAAKPSTNEFPTYHEWELSKQWEQWCSSQTWSVNILPHLKYLGIRCPTGYSQSECLDDLPLLRLVGWTRTFLTRPLEHLKVWEGGQSTGDIAVDYISTGYLDKHIGESMDPHDAGIVMGMVVGHLVIDFRNEPLLQLHSTVLFRQLQRLNLVGIWNAAIPILSYLEQIKRLEIRFGCLPEYSLNTDLPLTHTLQWFHQSHVSSSWMLGRTFKALREIWIDMHKVGNQPRHEGLQVDLPACTTLALTYCPMSSLRFFSCPVVQIFRLELLPFELTAFHLFHDFLFNLSCLQNLRIFAHHGLGTDPLIRFVFYGALEKGAWRDIRSVEVKTTFDSSSEVSGFIDRTVGQQRYEKWWKTFTSERDYYDVTLTASA